MIKLGKSGHYNAPFIQFLFTYWFFILKATKFVGI